MSKRGRGGKGGARRGGRGGSASKGSSSAGFGDDLPPDASFNSNGMSMDMMPAAPPSIGMMGNSVSGLSVSDDPFSSPSAFDDGAASNSMSIGNLGGLAMQNSLGAMGMGMGMDMGMGMGMYEDGDGDLAMRDGHLTPVTGLATPTPSTARRQQSDPFASSMMGADNGHTASSPPPPPSSSSLSHSHSHVAPPAAAPKPKGRPRKSGTAGGAGAGSKSKRHHSSSSHESSGNAAAAAASSASSAASSHPVAAVASHPVLSANLTLRSLSLLAPSAPLAKLISGGSGSGGAISLSASSVSATNKVLASFDSDELKTLALELHSIQREAKQRAEYLDAEMRKIYQVKAMLAQGADNGAGPIAASIPSIDKEPWYQTCMNALHGIDMRAEEEFRKEITSMTLATEADEAAAQAAASAAAIAGKRKREGEGATAIELVSPSGKASAAITATAVTPTSASALASTAAAPSKKKKFGGGSSTSSSHPIHVPMGTSTRKAAESSSTGIYDESWDWDDEDFASDTETPTHKPKKGKKLTEKEKQRQIANFWSEVDAHFQFPTSEQVATIHPQSSNNFYRNYHGPESSASFGVKDSPPPPSPSSSSSSAASDSDSDDEDNDDDEKGKGSRKQRARRDKAFVIPPLGEDWREKMEREREKELQQQKEEEERKEKEKAAATAAAGEGDDGLPLPPPLPTVGGVSSSTTEQKDGDKEKDKGKDEKKDGSTTTAAASSTKKKKSSSTTTKKSKKSVTALLSAMGIDDGKIRKQIFETDKNLGGDKSFTNPNAQTLSHRLLSLLMEQPAGAPKSGPWYPHPSGKDAKPATAAPNAHKKKASEYSLDKRIEMELKYIGLLGGVSEWNYPRELNDRTDDELSAAIRRVQKELSDVLESINPSKQILHKTTKNLTDHTMKLQQLHEAEQQLIRAYQSRHSNAAHTTSGKKKTLASLHASSLPPPPGFDAIAERAVKSWDSTIDSIGSRRHLTGFIPDPVDLGGIPRNRLHLYPPKRSYAQVFEEGVEVKWKPKRKRNKKSMDKDKDENDDDDDDDDDDAEREGEEDDGDDDGSTMSDTTDETPQWTHYIPPQHPHNPDYEPLLPPSMTPVASIPVPSVPVASIHQPTQVQSPYQTHANYSPHPFSPSMPDGMRHLRSPSYNGTTPAHAQVVSPHPHAHAHAHAHATTAFPFSPRAAQAIPASNGVSPVGAAHHQRKGSYPPTPTIAHPVQPPTQATYLLATPTQHLPPQPVTAYASPRHQHRQTSHGHGTAAAPLPSAYPQQQNGTQPPHTPYPHTPTPSHSTPRHHPRQQRASNQQGYHSSSQPAIPAHSNAGIPSSSSTSLPPASSPPAPSRVSTGNSIGLLPPSVDLGGTFDGGMGMAMGMGGMGMFLSPPHSPINQSINKSNKGNTDGDSLFIGSLPPTDASFGLGGTGDDLFGL